MKQLADKLAIVTDASSGIGRATAIRFARDGVALILAARRGHELRKPARDIRQFGGRAVPVSYDAKSEDDASILAEQAMIHSGGTDAPMAQEFEGGETEKDLLNSMHALKQQADPDEIVTAARYLASPTSSFVTGSALLVDGGVSICRT